MLNQQTIIKSTYPNGKILSIEINAIRRQFDKDIYD